MAEIKKKPEFFIVEEELNVPLKKDGKFRVYRLRKVGLETEEALRKIAKASNVSFRDISFCGRKDKNAVTIQHIAVPKGILLKGPDEDERVCVEEVGFVDSPLKASFIKRNKFSIIVLNKFLPESFRVEVAKTVGVPNYYGEQRFAGVRRGEFFVEFLVKGLKREALLYLFTPSGWEGSRDKKGKKLFLEGNYQEALGYLRGWRRSLAKRLLKGSINLERTFDLIPREEIVFQFNVYQSFLFNELLSGIVREKSPSSLTFKYKLGTLFFPLKPISTPLSLPIFHPESPFKKFYEGLLSKRGFKTEDFKPFSKFFHFFNRPTFVKVGDLTVKKCEYGVKLNFSLPPGSYATNVVRFLYDAV